MKIYQIGGSVRDELLNKKPSDIDYVVVGSTVEEMKAKGFRQVGRGFPVFLHPETHDEYALARKEIKTGDKHTDFKFIFDPSITLEDDVKRRDFTINAIAKDVDSGEIIDLVNGKKDLEDKILRHVDDEHFPEDPLRVLRMCRFAAKMDFQIAPETMQLAQKMVQEKKLSHLYPERVWGEIRKALDTKHFDLFIKYMRECGALKEVLPDVEKLWSVPEKPEYHPEGNSGDHTLLTIKASNQEDPLVTFALLLHDIGKTRTRKDLLPSHHGHEINGLPLIKKICYRLNVPGKFRSFALLCCKNHMKFFHIQEMRIGTLYDFLKEVTNNFKDLETFNRFAEVCRSDNYGRAVELSDADKAKHAKSLEICQNAIQKVLKVNITAMPHFENLFKDPNFGAKVREYIITQMMRD